LSASSSSSVSSLSSFELVSPSHSARHSPTAQLVDDAAAAAPAIGSEGAPPVNPPQQLSRSASQDSNGSRGSFELIARTPSPAGSDLIAVASALHCSPSASALSLLSPVRGLSMQSAANGFDLTAVGAADEDDAVECVASPSDALVLAATAAAETSVSPSLSEEDEKRHECGGAEEEEDDGDVPDISEAVDAAVRALAKQCAHFEEEDMPDISEAVEAAVQARAQQRAENGLDEEESDDEDEEEDVFDEAYDGVGPLSSSVSLKQRQQSSLGVRTTLTSRRTRKQMREEQRASLMQARAMRSQMRAAAAAVPKPPQPAALQALRAGKGHAHRAAAMHSTAMAAHTSAAVGAHAVPFASRSKAQQRRVDMTPPRELERQQKHAEQAARQTIKAANKKPKLIFARHNEDDDRQRVKSRQHRAANPLLLADRTAPLSKQDRGVFMLQLPGARMLKSTGPNMMLQQLRTVLPSLQSYVQRRVQGHFACGGVHVTDIFCDKQAVWPGRSYIWDRLGHWGTIGSMLSSTDRHKRPMAVRLELRANERPLTQLPRVMLDHRRQDGADDPCAGSYRSETSAELKEMASDAVAAATGHKPRPSRDLVFPPMARSFHVTALLRVEGAHALTVKPLKRRLAWAFALVRNRPSPLRHWLDSYRPRWINYQRARQCLKEQLEGPVRRGIEVALFCVDYAQVSSHVPAAGSSPVGSSPARRTLTVTKQIQRAAKRICVTTVAARKVQRRHQRALQDRVRQSDCDDRRRERAAHETEGEGEES
jgi:hypothetical protein